MILFFKSELTMQMRRKEMRELSEVHIGIVGRRMELTIMKKLMQCLTFHYIRFVGHPKHIIEHALHF